MATPKRPGQMYLSRYGGPDVVCDPQLLARAFAYRVQNGWVTPDDFYRLNITVWKLEAKSGAVEYYPRENDTGEELFDQAVKLRTDKGLTKTAARKSANEYPTRGGIHSEVNVAAEIYRRPDISSGATRVTQIFTERRPCGACQSFLEKNFPAFHAAPFFYYLLAPGTERRWQVKPSGSVGLYLMERYGA